MTRLPPLQRSDLPQYEDRFKMFEEGMGFVPESLLLLARRPEIFEGFSQLMRAVWHTGTVDETLKPLVALMASAAAGCQYCQAHEAARATTHGATEEKVAALWEFETSDLYDEAERAALRLARDAAQVPNLVTDDHFEQLREHYSVDEIVELMAVIGAFGFLNRWNDSLATTLEDVPNAAGDRLLGGFEWTAGKHGSHEGSP